MGASRVRRPGALMPTFKYTTTVAVNRTIGDLQGALAAHGASSISVDYDGGKPSGLAFVLPTPHGDRHFALPVDVAAVHRLLTAQKNGRDGHTKNGRVDDRREQAERVAWRVLHDWLVAQLAIIEAQMATLTQIMLPYLKVDADHTLYEAYKDREQAALTA